MAAVLVMPELMVAAVACVSFGSKAVEQEVPPVVVNCACE